MSAHYESHVLIDSYRHLVERWRQTYRSGSIEDRTLSEVTVSLPPQIAEVKPTIPSAIAVAMDEALREIVENAHRCLEGQHRESGEADACRIGEN